MPTRQSYHFKKTCLLQCVILAILTISVPGAEQLLETKPFGFSTEATKQAFKTGTFKIVPSDSESQPKGIVSLIPGKENILLNRPYECVPKPNYPLCKDNDDKDLTDGKVSSKTWRDPALVGCTAPTTITIDLAKESAIGTVVLRLAHNRNDLGVQFPDKIAIFTTNDHKSFMVGGYFLPEIKKGFVAQDYALFKFSSLNLKGRYLVIMLTPSAMIDEIQAFAAPEGTDSSRNLIVSHNQLDPIPFYLRRELYVSDTPMPFLLKKALVGQVKITLPPTVEIVEPAAWDNCKILDIKKFKDRVEYTLNGVVRHLYIQAIGEEKKEKLLGTGLIEWREQQQPLSVYQIKIPRVAAPKELILTNGFASYENWSRWPDFPQAYVQCGMNHLDINFIDIQYLRKQAPWPAPKAPRVEFYQNLTKTYGLQIITGCSFPEKKTIAKLSSDPNIRKYVDYLGKVRNDSVCPFEYSADKDHDAVIDAVASFGCNLIFCDYEPNWQHYGGSRGCCCNVCREKFRGYFSQNFNNGDYIDPLEIFKNTTRYSLNYQAWIKWQTDAVSSRLFGNLQKRLVEKLKRKFKIGYYAVSPLPLNSFRFPYTNYNQLYENGWAGIEMPYYYKMTAVALWEKFREDKQAQIPGDLLIPWLSVGSGDGYADLPHEQVRYMVLEALAAGLDGICWYTVGGFDAKKWQQLALAIDEAAPAAPLIKGSCLLEPAVVKAKNALIRGVSNNGDIYLIVANYSAEVPVTAEVEVDVSKEVIVIDCQNKQKVDARSINGKVTFTTMLDSNMMARTFLIVSNKNIGKYLLPRQFICPETVNGKIWWSPGALQAESYKVRIGRNQDLSDAKEFAVSDTQLDVGAVLPHGKYYWQVIQTSKGMNSESASEISTVVIK